MILYKESLTYLWRSRDNISCAFKICIVCFFLLLKVQNSLTYLQSGPLWTNPNFVAPDVLHTLKID